MKRIALLTIIQLSMIPLAAQQPVWLDPKVNSENEKPDVADYFAYENADKAAAADKNQSGRFMSIEGNWKFNFVKNAYDKEVITTTPQVGENTVETNVTNTNNDSKKPETPETPQSVTGTNTSNNTNTNNTTESKVVIKDTKKNTDTNVKTGDASGAMLGIMGLLSVISMAYIGLWLVLKRKKK